MTEVARTYLAGTIASPPTCRLGRDLVEAAQYGVEGQLGAREDLLEDDARQGEGVRHHDEALISAQHGALVLLSYELQAESLKCDRALEAG